MSQLATACQREKLLKAREPVICENKRVEGGQTRADLGINRGDLVVA